MSKMTRSLPLTTLAVALTTAFAGPAYAQTIDELSKPQSTVTLGVGFLDGTAPLNGMYTGRTDNEEFGFAELDFAHRYASGISAALRARDIGRDTGEFRADVNRQGDWGVKLGYVQTMRDDPFAINTRLTGIGTETQTVQGLATPQEVHLGMARDETILGVSKFFGPYEVKLGFRNEIKTGARLYGARLLNGTTGNSFQAFLTEPVDRETTEFDATLAYADPKLQLNGGYRFSVFDNATPRLTERWNAQVAHISQPLSNSAHHLFLNGGYNFTPATRASFKVAQTIAKQDEPFIDIAGASPNVNRLAGNTATSLDGEVETTLLYATVISRLTRDVSVNASVRHEKRDDKTPTLQFIAASATNDGGKNIARDFESLTAKTEAGYQLNRETKLVAGLEFESKERTPRFFSVAYRKRSDETSLRLEAKRVLAEMLNGSLAAIRSERRGTGLQPSGNAAAGAYNPITTPVNDIHWTDRARDKIRLAMDFTPSEKLTVQLLADGSRDEFPAIREFGRQNGKGHFVSLDAHYAMTDEWSLTGWASTDYNEGVQRSLGSGTVWAADLRNTNTSYGLGLRGKPMPQMSVGADLGFASDRMQYRLSTVSGAVAVKSLPDIRYEQTSVKVFGAYDIQKNTTLRLDLAHDYRVTDDWTWGAGWSYQDGTTVTLPRVQRISFLGLSVSQRFW